MMENAQYERLGVRAEWLFAVVRQLQVLAWEIATGSASADLRKLVTDTAGTDSGGLERLILDGLLSQTQRHAHTVGHLAADSSRGVDLARRAAALLCDHYAEQWTLESLARHLRTNRCTLTKEFKKLHGLGVHEYLVRRRIAQAQRRIDDGEKVEFAAYAAGFHSSRAFFAARSRLSAGS
jgi:AraC-like DNA-binding protein